MISGLDVLTQYDTNFKWFFENFSTIKKEYKDIYVAVNNKQIVDTDKDIQKLYNKLEHKGIPLDTTFVRFVPKTDIIAIL